MTREETLDAIYCSMQCAGHLSTEDRWFIFNIITKHPQRFADRVNLRSGELTTGADFAAWVLRTCKDIAAGGAS